MKAKGEPVPIRDEDRTEAERLKLLPRGEQRQIVAIVRAVADDPKVPEADRREARRRASALEQLLRLTPKKK
jgi:ABC-type methionine transport system ATPase subunit